LITYLYVCDDDGDNIDDDDDNDDGDDNDNDDGDDYDDDNDDDDGDDNNDDNDDDDDDDNNDYNDDKIHLFVSHKKLISQVKNRCFYTLQSCIFTYIHIYNIQIHA
jgi:hypothetical protein